VPFTITTFGNCETIADVTLQAGVTGNLLRDATGPGQGALRQGEDRIF